MSNNGQHHPTHLRCSIQDQGGLRSTQRAQNFGPIKQRIRYSCSDDHRFETTGIGRYANCIRDWHQQTSPICLATRTNRGSFISTDWTTQSGKPLAQKNTDELIGDQSSDD